jgi:hypothetical protein
MPRYDYDEDGDLILSDDPVAIAQRAKTARIKAMKEADPEKYGLAMDPRSVAQRKETREKLERGERKLEYRNWVLEKEESNQDEVKPVLPDPRDKTAEPETPISPVGITQVAPAEPLQPDRLAGRNIGVPTMETTAKRILTTVSDQLHIMSGQIDILKTLVSK